MFFYVFDYHLPLKQLLQMQCIKSDIDKYISLLYEKGKMDF